MVKLTQTRQNQYRVFHIKNVPTQKTTSRVNSYAKGGGRLDRNRPHWKQVYLDHKLETDKWHKIFGQIVILFIILGAVIALYVHLTRKPTLIYPCPNSCVESLLHTPTAYALEVPVEVPQQNIDTFVGESVDYFFKNPVNRSEMRMVIHCLLSRESKHGNSKGKGDNGLASGPMQYHQATWVGMRNKMIKQGLVTEVGDRDNLKDSIFTTVWAIKNGSENDWGPILRWNNGKYTQYTCQAPTLTHE